MWDSGTSLAVQWLGPSTSTDMGLGSIPSQGTTIPQAAQPDQINKQINKQKKFFFKCGILCFPGGSNSKESACNAGDPGSIPGSGRCPGEGNGNSLQYSCLENSMDRVAWWATVHGMTEWDMTESWTHTNQRNRNIVLYPLQADSKKT